MKMAPKTQKPPNMKKHPEKPAESQSNKKNCATIAQPTQLDNTAIETPFSGNMSDM